MRALRLIAVLAFVTNVMWWFTPSAQGAILAAGIAAFNKNERFSLRRIEDPTFDRVTSIDTPLRKPNLKTKPQHSRKNGIAP